jgi:hypothetical protein
MKRPTSTCLAAALLVLAPGDGAAASGAPPSPAVVISMGYVEAIDEVGPLPPAWLEKQSKDVKDKVDGFKAGYKCRVFTILWAVIHRKDCTPVAFAGKAYLKGEPVADPKKDWVAGLNQAIAAKYKPEDMKLSFWTKHGRFVLAGILGLLILSWIIKRARRS